MRPLVRIALIRPLVVIALVGPDDVAYGGPADGAVRPSLPQLHPAPVTHAHVAALVQNRVHLTTNQNELFFLVKNYPKKVKDKNKLIV